MLDTEDGPRQMVLDRFGGKVDLIDFREEADPEGAARRFMERDMAVPLPFGPEGPLARFAVVRCGPELFFWYGKFHHIVADGWGTSLFHASLIKCFNEKSAGRSFPDLDLCCVSQQLRHEAEYRAAFEADRAYWQQRFPALPEPLFSQSGSYSTRAFRHTVHFEGSLYDRVRALADAEKASPFHLLLGALGIVLSRQCVTRELIIAVPILNRRTAADKRDWALRKRDSSAPLPGRRYQHARFDRPSAQPVAPGLQASALPNLRTQAAGIA
jgi:hypothetical protein